MSRFVSLADCPPGVFLFDGTLALKTEYTTGTGEIEAFCLGSGEFFWGGTNCHNARAKLMVQPLEVVIS